MNRIGKLLEFLKTSPKDNMLRHALALEYIKIGAEADAKKLFETILTEFPDYVGSYYHLAKLLERKGDFTTALNWYKRGMEEAIKAGDQHAYNELLAAYEDLTD